MVIRLPLLLLLGICALGSTRAIAASSSQEKALRLFRLITGVPLNLRDPRLEPMAAKITEGKILEAARMASDDDAFFNVTLRHWASALSNRGEVSNVDMNDFVALVIAHTSGRKINGQIVTAPDFRELLYENIRAEATPHPFGKVFPNPMVNNDYFLQLDEAHSNFRQILAVKQPQWDNTVSWPPGSGLLTTWSWGRAHYLAGTNRRPVEYVFREFMCTPIKDMADSFIRPSYVRQDVDRLPGGDDEVFRSKCTTCHAGLDALSGAFAYINFKESLEKYPDGTSNFRNGKLIYQYRRGEGLLQSDYPANGVHPKITRNSSVYSGGYVQTDDSWANFFTERKNASFGWSDNVPTSGNGIPTFGRMIANSKGFASCMAKRVFSQMCLKKDFHFERMTQEDHAFLKANAKTIETLTQNFQNNGYQIRRLFEEAASLRQCLGD